MEPIVLQITGKGNRLDDHFENESDVVHIGRAFSNDLILSDPYIAPEQISLEFLDNAWHLQILEKTNPILINGKRPTEDKVKLSSGDSIALGRTYLHFYLKSHRVLPVQALEATDMVFRGAFKFLLPLFAVLLAVGLDVLYDYQEVYTDYKWQRPARAEITLLGIILFWSGIWALMGRLLKHQMHLPLQIFAVASMIVALIVFLPFSAYLEYQVSHPDIGRYTRWAIYYVVLAYLLNINFSYATFISKPRLVSGAVAFVLVIGTYGVKTFNLQEKGVLPDASTVLKPPIAKIAEDSPVDDYIERYDIQFEILKEKLEEDK